MRRPSGKKAASEPTRLIPGSGSVRGCPAPVGRRTTRDALPPPDQVSAEVDRLWEQVRPLYFSLYTFVRARLSQKYGPQVMPPDGPMRADLLGNPWAQTWAMFSRCWAFPKIARAMT